MIGILGSALALVLTWCALAWMATANDPELPPAYRQAVAQTAGSVMLAAVIGGVVGFIFQYFLG